MNKLRLHLSLFVVPAKKHYKKFDECLMKAHYTTRSR